MLHAFTQRSAFLVLQLPFGMPVIYWGVAKKFNP
jgi:hypothetical protein